MTAPGLSSFLELANTGEGCDYFMVVGPIDSKRHLRHLRIAIDHTEGIPARVDLSLLTIAAALVVDPTPSIANLTTGINILGRGQFTIGNKIYLMNPYVAAGRRVQYAMPLPHFPDAKARFAMMYLNAMNIAGNPVPCVHASIEQRSSGVPMSSPTLSTYSEHDSSIQSFQSIGPFLANDERASLVVTIGCDADAVIAFYVALVEGVGSDLDTLAGGINVLGHSSQTLKGINGIKFSTTTGDFKTYKIPLPVIADATMRRALLCVTGSIAPVHISVLMSFEPGSKISTTVGGIS